MGAGVAVRAVHIGEVTDNNDPEKRGRIKVKCGTIMPSGDELPWWIDSLFQFKSSSSGASLWLPEVGDLVEIEIAVGHTHDSIPGMTSVSSPDIRWRGAVSNDNDDLPDALTTSYPNRRGWVTKSGHMIIFDDSDDNGEVILSHRNGNIVQMDKDGNVTLQSAQTITVKGGHVVVDSGDVKLGQGTMGALLKAAYHDSVIVPHTHPVAGATAGPATFGPLVSGTEKTGTVTGG